MKQRITDKQLNELSEKNYDKLLEWHFKKGHTSPPKLSIGQMFDFLASKGISKKLVFIEFLIDKGCINTETLCDDLWQEVKQVINYKN